MISCTTSQPSTIRPVSLVSCRRSSSALIATAVLEIEMPSPAPGTPEAGQPSSTPIAQPRPVQAMTWISTPGTATCHTAMRSRSEKCSPIVNISNATPISASSVERCWSATKPGV